MSTFIVKDAHVTLGGRAVLNGAGFTASRGQVTGLIGANGAGKTTVLRLLAGLLFPAKGQVTLDGATVKSDIAFARRVAYLEQHPASQWPLSVETLVDLGRLPFRGFGAKQTDADRRAIDRALGDTDTLSFRDRSVNSLSGGEKARVFLARALAGTPEWLLADEPVAGLDPAHQLTTMQLLRQKSQDDGLGVVLSLHDLTLAARFCDHLVLLHEGQVLISGTPEAVLKPQHLRKALGIKAFSGIHEEESFVLPWSASSN
ncbi:MAG: ABC transporter ATP-binding protein [Alphaproteobacteria bacterium]|nr:ABC transporter ATP-binding protein [Alphaproteobacteria bacterium]